MSNEFYTPSGAPSTSGSLASATIRAEFVLIQSSFDKLPHLGGNGLSIVRVNAGGTSMESVGVSGTGSVVMTNSPSLVTPTLGAASATTLSVSGQITSTQATGSAPLVVASTTRVTNLNVDRAALADVATTATTAASVTTNANLTGPITSSGNATSVASQTGTGTKFVMDTSPTLVTPNIGTPSAGVLTSCNGLPVSSGISGLGASVATFLATPTSANFAAAITDETGTGSVVLSASPTFTGTLTAAAVAAKGVAEQNNAISPGSGAGVTLDWSFGGSKITVNGTNAITFSNIPAGTAGHWVDVSNFNSVTWPAAVDWGLGGISSIAGRATVVLATDDSGTKVFGSVSWRAV